MGRRAISVAVVVAVVFGALLWLLEEREDEELPRERSALEEGGRVTTCDDRVEGSGPRATTPEVIKGRVVIGPVSFAGLARLADRRQLETLRRRREGGYGVKAGASVRAGETVTIAVDGRHVKVHYPRPGDRGSTADNVWTLAACPDEHPSFTGTGTVGPTTGFAGGFEVDAPRCATISVHVAGERDPIRKAVSFGAGRCPQPQ